LYGDNPTGATVGDEPLSSGPADQLNKRIFGLRSAASQRCGVIVDGYQWSISLSIFGWLGTFGGQGRNKENNDTTPKVTGYSQFKTGNAGLNTITTFDGGREGQRITVMGADGAKTQINHGATIKHKHSAYVWLGDYDSITYVLNGTVWTEVYRIIVSDDNSYTQTELRDANSIVNNSDKYAGKGVWDETNTQMVWAIGNTGVWVDETGATVHTPV